MGWLSWFRGCIGLHTAEKIKLANKTGKVLLFLGLNNSGKTTLLGMLGADEVPTQHNNSRSPFHSNVVEELTLGDIKRYMGGRVEARRLWNDYFTKADGVVFVVDAADPESFNEAKIVLRMLLEADELAKAPFVILGNKVDLPSATSERNLVTEMRLEGLLTGKQSKVAANSGMRPLEVYMCSAVKNVGFRDAFCWLCQHVQHS